MKKYSKRFASLLIIFAIIVSQISIVKVSYASSIYDETNLSSVEYNQLSSKFSDLLEKLKLAEKAEKIAKDAQKKAAELAEKAKKETKIALGKAKKATEDAEIAIGKAKEEAEKYAEKVKEESKIAIAKAEKAAEDAKILAKETKEKAEKLIEETKLEAEKAKEDAEKLIEKIKKEAERTKEDAEKILAEAKKTKEDAEKILAEAKKLKEELDPFMSFISKVIKDIDLNEDIDFNELFVSIITPIKDSIDKAISQTIITTGETITNSIVNSADKIGKNIADAINNTTDKIIDTGIDKVADNIGNIMKELFSGSIEGIIEKSGNEISKKIENIINSIKDISNLNRLTSATDIEDITMKFNVLKDNLYNANEDFNSLKLDINNDDNLTAKEKYILNNAVTAAQNILSESNDSIDKSLEENKDRIDEINKNLNENKDTSKVEVKRVSGKNRIETAIKAAEDAYPEGNKNIILVSGSTFADALAANSLVNKYDAPILLTDFNVLATEVSDYLDKYKVENVFIIGGTNSISKNIVKTIEDKNIKTKRISGDNRFDTSLEILKLNISEDTKTNIIIASGDNKKFADALAASSVSANDGTSIVLTNGTTLDENIINYINENKSSIENVYIVGGTNSVNDSVTDNIDFEATRVSGSNRVATSLEIANAFFKENKNVVLADGRNFPDALAAGGLSKKDKAPIILNDSDVINKEIINFVNTNEIENITIIGGMYSVPNYPSK